MKSRSFAAVLVLVMVAVLLFIGIPAGAGVSPVLSAEETVSPVIHHDLSVRVFPSHRRISVRDSITLSGTYPSELVFSLHQGLTVTASEGAAISRIEEGSSAPSYRAVLHDGVRSFVLSYEGEIDHPIEPVGKEQARGFSATRGIVSDEGVYLAGESFWYPVIPGGLLSFRMEVRLPVGWDAVSQGGSDGRHASADASSVIWHAVEPQEEIYLVAARFTAYRKSVGSPEALVYLRSPDRALAEKYLDATGRYLSLYERMIGPYPYPKFAMVENFWETGYGMPSFTLLGPKVIRLPFILTSSYPHEILHNWWGNSVFPDYGRGNWSEGLTAYLADHLIKEQQSGGTEYRQTTLQKYADYVDAGRDFPLTSFTSRHSSPSEAIGYGKSLMLFHMLRRDLGDSLFVQGLRRFYAAYRFRSASFADLMQSFSAMSGQDLGPFFSQWVERTGAPEIRIVSAARERVDGGDGLALVIEQVQEGPAYSLSIPVAVSLSGRVEAHQEVLSMTGKQQEFRIRLPGRPDRVDVDPEHDLFRRLDRSEIPPAISSVLGSRRLLVILPSEAPDAMLAAYQSLGRAIGLSGPDDVQIRLDSSIDRLPDDRAVVILGWENHFLKETSGVFAAQGAQLSETAFSINDTAMAKKGHSIALTARRDAGSAIAFIAAADSAALPGLARKLPHYHKYSYLVFEGSEPANILKGRWEIRRSPLTAFIPEPGESGRGVPLASLAPRPALADLPEQFSRSGMIETVRFLADPDQQGRGFGSAGLDRSAEYIAREFKAAGLMPAGDDESFFQSWEEAGGPENRKAVLRNVIAAFPGTDPSLSRQCVIVGAHYDHLGLGWPDVREGNAGTIHPGADDNASGIAVLLELARFFGQQPKPKRTIVFAAFTAEEAGRLGSRHYLAAETAYQPKDCIAMINLDTVGRLGRNKIIVLNASTAAEWPHIFRGAGYVTGTEIAISDQQLDSSDQMTFQEKGIPAVQIFTGAHADYHRPTDTSEKIDAAGLVKVTAVVKEAVEYLAARNEPLTSAGDLRTGEQRKGRTASLGIIPDYAGSGCVVSGVVPGSPAEACGIRAGDVIVAVNDHPITGLRDLADVLKTVEPGAKLTIRILRGGREQTVETEAAPR